MHQSVLYHESLEALALRSGGRYIDGTLGAAGHTLGILAGSSPDGKVLAFDRDQAAIQLARKNIEAAGSAENITIIHASYAEMDAHAAAHGFAAVDGILLDLGLSSMQLDSAERGFSFRFDAPLDMRFDTSGGITAEQLINISSEAELVDILWRYGEERRSRKIAKYIMAARPIRTTTQLATLIADKAPWRRRIHPATQTFQALRIAVNEELSALESGLKTALAHLAPGGRLVVISFHSLEDRLVKRQFRKWAQNCICPPKQPICTCTHKSAGKLVQRKAIQPSRSEIADNPRSRSARLRAFERHSENRDHSA